MDVVIVALLGLAFGSFITLASWRLPRGEGMVMESSRCTSCRARLAVRDLVPLLSWCAAKGMCRQCGAKVHWRYPLIEAVTALFFVMLYLNFGLTLQTALLMLFAVALLILIVVDFEHYLIPDAVQIFLALLAIVYRYAMKQPLEDALSGALFGLVIGAALRYGYWLIRKQEGLGMGDVKFLAVAGLWLGFQGMVPFLFHAGLFGVLTALAWRMANRGKLFPFGPALACSLFVCVVVPQAVSGFWALQMILKG